MSTLADSDLAVYASGALLPGPRATLAGPIFEEWLNLNIPFAQIGDLRLDGSSGVKAASAEMAV